MNRLEYKKLFEEWTRSLVLEKGDDITLLSPDVEKVENSDSADETIRKAKIVLQTAINVLDPTGFTNLPTFLEAHVKYQQNATIENAAILVLEGISLVPGITLFTKLYRMAKAGTSLVKLNKAQRKIAKSFTAHTEIKVVDAFGDISEGLNDLKRVAKEKPKEIKDIITRIKNSDQSAVQKNIEILLLMNDNEALNTLNAALDEAKEGLPFIYEFKETTLSNTSNLEETISLKDIKMLHSLLSSAESEDGKRSSGEIVLSSKIIKVIRSFVGDEKINGKDKAYEILWQNEWKKPETHSSEQIHKNIIEKIKEYMEKLSNEE